MIGLIGRRFFHTGCASMAAVRSSSLGKLRKSTGYSISNCKKALEMFPEDVTKAEEWLHDEAKQKGWAKTQGRSAMQGLVGVFSKDNVGVMVEVNCETDFVSKNAEFQQLVENILTGCVNHVSSCSSNEDITKTVLEESQLSEMKFNTMTVGELVSSAVCKFNEKTVAKRAVCFKVKDCVTLSSSSHPSISCPTMQGATLGKYGTLLAYKKNNDKHDDNSEQLGLNVCQHIIGMNPSSIGVLKSEDILRLMKKANSEEDLGAYRVTETNKLEDSTPTEQTANSTEPPPDDSEEVEGQETLNVNLKDTDETRLLFQPFLLDSNTSVGEVLFKSGIQVLEYERYECGEKVTEDVGVKQSSVGI